jgi:hypothetical protein
MTEPAGSEPVPYQVIYSKEARPQLIALLARGTSLGFGPLCLRAIKTIEAQLRIYPQVGEPLRDLPEVGQTLYGYTISPPHVQHIIDEAERKVYVTGPIKPIPPCGF